MELIDYYKTIRLLREKNENKKLIIFIGSGVSKNVESMPSWKDLIVAMANFSGYSKCNDCKLKRKGCNTKCTIRTEFSPDEYLKIPQYAYNKDPDKYSQIINQCFPPVNVDAPLSQVIFDICPDHIITTNYDNLLESSTNMYRDQYDLIVKDEDLLCAKKSKYIIKMHGDLENPSTIVLKESDYLDYSQNHILIETFVKALLTDHILLFLGYSVSDYNIKLIINWINFLRSQKGEAQSNSVGYLVLDKQKISNLEIEYFKKNGIEIVNINQIPMIKDIPSTVKYDEGKRLYSFLSYIKNSSLDTIVDANSHFRYITELAKNNNVTNLEILLKLLLIQGYKISLTLTLYDEGQYLQLRRFLNSQAEEVKDLKQLFVDCGIKYITYQSRDINKKPEYIFMGKDINNQLFQNQLFILYVENRYVELKEQTETCFTLTNFFYQSLILSPRFTVDKARTFFAKIEKKSIVSSEKASYFYNQDLLDIFNFRKGQSLRNFLSSIESKSLDIIFKPYKDLTEGNRSDLNTLLEYLEKLKSDYSSTKIILGDTLSNLYKIQNFALQKFFFYFQNNLVFNGITNLHRYLYPYIEAIFCTNGEYKVMNYGFNFPSSKTRYQIYPLDLCIITKFIGPKELCALVKKYNVSRLTLSKETTKYFVSSLENLVNSIISPQITDYEILSILINFTKLVPLMEFSPAEINRMSVSFNGLLQNEKFLSWFCSHILPDAKQCVRTFTNFLSGIDIKNGVTIVEKILNCAQFKDFVQRLGEYEIRCFFREILHKYTSARIQNRLISIAVSAEDIHQRIQRIYFFLDEITSEKNLSVVRKILNESQKAIPRDLLYEFIWDKLVIYNQKDAEDAIETFLRLDQQSNNSPIVIPNPIERELEFICLMQITGVITDLSRLADIAHKYPTLHFLIDPDHFDYTQVDLSNYMWENFARRADLRQKLIEHKSEIIPNIKKKLQIGETSEFEKKMLYRYLLQDDEIWNI